MRERDNRTCPNCRGTLKHYDHVTRIIRTKGRRKKFVKIERLRCQLCHKIHRDLPDSIVPYKHYEAEIIKGVKEGLITPSTYGYEDYPCELTMLRWLEQNIYPLL